MNEGSYAKDLRATVASGLGMDYPEEAPSDDHSMLMEYLRDQRWALDELESVLAGLARKVKPIHVDMTEANQKEAENPRPVLSPALLEVAANTDNIRYKTRLIQALTNSLQV